VEKKPTGIPSVMASEGGIVHPLTVVIPVVGYREEYVKFEMRSSPLECGAKEGDSPVYFNSYFSFLFSPSRAIWEYSSKMGGKVDIQD
jgi:hypothetical protein